MLALLLVLLLLLLLVLSGNEGSVDKLLKQIGGFMSDIAGQQGPVSLYTERSS